MNREGASHDEALLRRFHDDPARAWDEFLDRHANSIFRHLQRLRFDYDDAMDCFTYVCEKLAEQNFRRMRSIRRTGTSGDLTPWLLKVVQRMSVSWIWSREGRTRLLKPIAQLAPREQRVFELHFRRGLSPLAIHEQLRIETQEPVDLGEVFAALERIHAALSPTKRWRLLCNLARSRGPLSLDELREDPVSPFEPADENADPESSLITREDEARLQRVLSTLPPRQRLVVQLRYEDGLEIAEIGRILKTGEREVKDCLAEAAAGLRRALEKDQGR